MSDFDVSIRRSFRDVAGLVLDCTSSDFEIEDVNRVQRWFNRAPPAPLTAGVRFGDPIAVTTVARPTVGPNGGAQFSRSASQYLVAPSVGSFGASSENWSIGLAIVPGLDTANDQTIVGSQNGTFKMQRFDAGGDFGYETPGPTSASGSGDTVRGAHLLALNGSATADWIVNNVAPPDIDDGAIAAFGFPADTSNAIFIGRDVAGGDHLDAELRGLHIWNRRLSPKERDFVFQTLDSTVDLSAGVGGVARCVVANKNWTDDTGDLTLNQANRLNPLAGILQQYILATLPGTIAASAAGIVQLACNTNGTVVADSGLGGDLYQTGFVESASLPNPLISQDAGWSSIFDIRFPSDAEGHYTLLFERPNHGALFVHIDVQQPQT